MLGTTLKLGSAKVAAVIDERYAREPDGWRKRRRLAVELAAKGAYTSAEVTELCGIARSHLFVWLRRERDGGIEALLERGSHAPRGGTRGDAGFGGFRFAPPPADFHDASGVKSS